MLTKTGFAGVLTVALAFGASLRAQDDKPATPPYKIGNGTSAPMVIYKVDPEYTSEARAAKIEGSVLLKVIVNTDGQVRQVSIVRSLDPGLDVKAAEAVQKWKFKPGTRDGTPVAVTAQIEMNFRLL